MCEVVIELNVGSCIGGYGVNLLTNADAVCEYEWICPVVF